MNHHLKARVLCDIEGFVFIKRARFARKTLQYVRIHGAVLSVQTNEKSSVKWDICLLGCKVTSLRAKSFAFSLKTGGSIYITLEGQGAKAADWSQILERVSQRHLEAEYTLGEKLGEGSFATVHMAVCNKTGEAVAVKSIVKRQFDTQMARELDREVRACASLRVPGVVQTHAIFHTQAKVHIVMDLMSGGTLKERVQDVGGRIAEHVAAPIILETLQALANLHRLGVAHRDIKMENILCDNPMLPTKRTALCDFGYVNFLDPGEETMRSLVGTPVYVAAEIAEKKAYGVGVDVWAVGIMLYRMISGFYPFDAGEDDEATLATIIDGDLKFPKDRWQSASPECIALIRGLLQPKTKTRLSAEGAIQHPWFEKWPLPDGLQAQKEHESDMKSAGAASQPAGTPSVQTVAMTDSVQAISDRLALQLADSSRECRVPPESKIDLATTLASNTRAKIRNRFRIAVAMVVFGYRLAVVARVRAPPASSSRPGNKGSTSKVGKIADSLLDLAHPVQRVPLVENTMVVSLDDYSTAGSQCSVASESSSVGSPISREETSHIGHSSPRPIEEVTPLIPIVPFLSTGKRTEDRATGEMPAESIQDDSADRPAVRGKSIRRLISFGLATPKEGHGRTPRSFGGFGRRIKSDSSLSPEPESEV